MYTARHPVPIMPTHFLLRTFDHAGYYETRSILAILGATIALYFWFRRGDRRYFVMFCSGVFFQALLEWYLQSGGSRGAGYNFSVYGVEMSGIAGNVFQGLAEGGIFALMAFWFVDLRTTAPIPRGLLRGYVAMYVLIVILAVFVGVVAAGQPITSPRPMASNTSLLRFAVTGVPAIVLCSLRKNGLRFLTTFYAGLLIYTVITFEPLHLLGARYIGVRAPGGGFMPAPLRDQVLWILYSHIVEVSFGKIHYFAVPFALGLIAFQTNKDVVSRRASL